MYCDVYRHSLKGQDARRCRHFLIHCIRHPSVRLTSLGEIAQHRKHTGEGRTNLKLLCGCCRELLTKMQKITSHMNAKGFHLKRSDIVGYNKDTFDPAGYLAESRNLAELSEAAVNARNAASEARQAQAAGAVADSSLLLGNPSFHTLSASSQSLLLAPVVNPLYSTSALALLSASGTGCEISAVPTTVTTALPSTAPVRSIFTILDSLSSSTISTPGCHRISTCLQILNHFGSGSGDPSPAPFPPPGGSYRISTRRQILNNFGSGDPPQGQSVMTLAEVIFGINFVRSARPLPPPVVGRI